MKTGVKRFIILIMTFIYVGFFNIEEMVAVVINWTFMVSFRFKWTTKFLRKKLL